MNRRAPKDVRTSTSDGAQGDQEDVALRAILDLGEGLRLVEAKADNKPPGISLQGRVAFDPLHAIDVEYIDRTPLVQFQVLLTGHLVPTNWPLSG